MKKYQSDCFFKSAKHALCGLYLTLRTQRNFIKHLLIAFLILILAIFLKANLIEISIIIATNAFVLVAELFNSVIEFIMDAYYKNKYSRLCKFAKDMSAGAVLLAALSSALIAFILLFPKLYDLVKN